MRNGFSVPYLVLYITRMGITYYYFCFILIAITGLKGVNFGVILINSYISNLRGEYPRNIRQLTWHLTFI